ncbi:glycosyl hydrolase family 18 protein [Paenibacillus sp. J2TS4]|uniref:glycosyl hydrolase family 18 protein n=1 Tax=Paenibacillus sp. J2TS4 TaxID=2807194 RepID=UPI001B2C377D|nr:glycosyl hydrolase family 18 protein [Paenibacillus sp. J2TS4]GIP35481.1 hypothetical protein J2TS4_46910 [Paenibacillus sp. J2TS4]
MSSSYGLSALPPLRRRRRRPFLKFFIFILFIGLISAAGYYWLNYWPNSSFTEPSTEGLEKPIYYKGKLYSVSASGAEESLKLPLSFMQEIVDPDIRHEPESQSVILTTKNKVVRLKTNELTAVVNEKPFDLKFAVDQQEDAVMIPIDPLLDLYRLKVIESEETGVVTVHKEGDVIQWAEVSGQSGDKPKAVRSEPSIKAPKYADLAAGEAIMVWSNEEDGWVRVQLNNGWVGYMQQDHILAGEEEMVPIEPDKSEFIPWNPTGGKIHLTWQQVHSRNPDTSQIGPMPGVNVISPQWFHLENEEGQLKNMADSSFVQWAHSQNYQVWALVTNSFDPKMTSEALSTYDRRMYMIKQLVSFGKMYNLQGINIDFENVYLKDKENMVQFVREAVPLMHEQDLVVSIDVGIKGGSETYSLFMDREAIGPLVDYMMVMTYDEHWASSPKAGSVASLPWVEHNIVRIMEEDGVPPSKLVLGVPYYTRIWTEETKEGKTSVSSKAVSMERIQSLIAEKQLTPVFDEKSGQNYVEYNEDDNIKIRIWIEDATSMKSRAELVNKYNLAGIASWSRGFETPDIWEIIKETFEQAH